MSLIDQNLVDSNNPACMLDSSLKSTERLNSEVPVESRFPAFVSLVASVVMIPGCHKQSTFGAIPPAPVGYTSTTDFNEECVARAEWIESDTGLDADMRKMARNREIAQRLMAVRFSHAVYIGRVSQHKAVFDTSTDILLAAGTAVSALDPVAAAGATNTALLAAKSSVDKNFYDDLSRSALLIDIYKNTQTSEASIYKNFSLSYEDYPLSRACADIDAFFYSASATVAVGASGTDSGPKESSSSQKAER